MNKTAALLVALVGLALIGLVDRDGRMGGADLAGSVFGYVVRLELRVERPQRSERVMPRGERGAGSGSFLAVCGIVPDSLARVVVWR